MKNIARAATLALSLLVVFCGWLIPRYPFFAHYPLACPAPDYSSYVNLAFQIVDGQTPLFLIRTPGYPFFLAQLFSLGSSNFSIVIVQSVLGLFSGLLLAYSFYRLRWWVSPVGAAAISLFFLLREKAYYDASLLSESLYTTFLMAVFAFLTLGVATRRSVYLALCSASMAFVIYIRPAGLCLVGTFILVLLGLCWLRAGWRAVFAFGTPFIALLLALSTYNYWTGNYFGVSAFGEGNLIGATGLIWQPRPDYPAELNRTIHDFHTSIPLKEREEVAHSWNLEELYRIFSIYYNPAVHEWLPKYWNGAFRSDFNTANMEFSNVYHLQRSIMRRLSLDSIESNPLGYIKFVLAQYYGYFWVTPSLRGGDFYAVEWYNCARAIYATREFFKESSPEWRKRVLLEYFEPHTPPGILLTEKSGIAAVPTRSLAIYRAVQSYIDPVVISPWWARVFFIGFACLVPYALLAIFSRRENLLIVAIVLAGGYSIILGQATVVALVEVALTRYSHTTDFYFLTLSVLAPLLMLAGLIEAYWLDKRPRRHEATYRAIH